MILTEKFYFCDVGIAGHLARRRPRLGGSDFGKAFEHWVLMEIMNYRRYQNPDLEVRFWRASTGQEVDFVLGEMDAAIEVKGAARAHEGDLRGLRAMRESHRVKHAALVCLEKEPRSLDRGIEILPWRVFLDRLWSGDLTR
jgi:predicted AAA+ superfamily ATPase